MKWEKIFTTHRSNRGLICTIYKIYIIRKRQKIQGKILEWHLTADNIHVINKYEKVLSCISHQGNANVRQ